MKGGGGGGQESSVKLAVAVPLTDSGRLRLVIMGVIISKTPQL